MTAVMDSEVQSRETEIHPSWCAQDRCYADLADMADHGSPRVERGAASAQIEQLVRWVGGRNVVDPPHVLAWMHGEGIADLPGRSTHELSASDCRDLAAVLLEAADLLDALI